MLREKSIKQLEEEIQAKKAKIEKMQEQRMAIINHFESVICTGIIPYYQRLDDDIKEAIAVLSKIPFELEIRERYRRMFSDGYMEEAQNFLDYNQKDFKDLTMEELEESNKLLQEITGIVIKYIEKNVKGYKELREQ